MARSLNSYESGLFLQQSSGASADTVIHLDGGAGVQLSVPWGSFIQDADYVRAGSDLILTGNDGARIIIVDFFNYPDPPALISDTGLIIDGAVAARLAGSQAPGQFAQAGGAGLAAAIGQVRTVEGEVIVTRADGSTEQLSAGDAIYQGDVVETGPESALGLVFADQSSFALGASGRVVLDEFVYDPASESGQAASTVVKGVFTFVSGGVAGFGQDAMVVKTPVYTIGIRGTEGVIRGAAEGFDNAVSLLKGGPLEVCTQAACVSLDGLGDTVANASASESPVLTIGLTQEQIIALYGQEMVSLYSHHLVRNADHAGQEGLMDAAGDGDDSGLTDVGEQEAAVQKDGFIDVYKEYIHEEEGEGWGLRLASLEPTSGPVPDFGLPKTQIAATESPYREFVAQTEGTGGSVVPPPPIVTPPPIIAPPPIVAPPPVVNQAPVVTADALAVTEGDSLGGTVNVLANDTDPEGDAMTVTPGSSIGLYGTLTLSSDGTATYVSDTTNAAVIGLRSGETLNETFSYQLADAAGNVTTGTLTVTIAGVTDPPLTLTGDQVPTNLADYLVGGTGADTIEGLLSADTLMGMAGDDYLDGGSGDDLVLGGAGDDVFYEDLGNDTLIGGSGDDYIDDFGGSNLLDGGPGADVILGASGQDTILGGPGDDDLWGWMGANSIDGGGGNDTVRGGTGDDIIVGGNGNDVISGASGDDILSGDGGSDVIIGGVGADTLTGGTGIDRFELNATDPLPSVITDFQPGQEILALDVSGWLTLLDGPLNAANFAVINTSFTGTNGGLGANQGLVYSTANNTLYLDADGDIGNGYSAEVAVLSNGAVLSSSDIVLQPVLDV